MMVEPEQGHPIQVVVHRTGLSPHVIRVWEKRYEAVEPMRTATNRRRYSNADIERLLLLQRATHSGRSIGQVAHLPTETLRDLVREDEAAIAPSAPPARSPTAPQPMQAYLDRCLEAVERLDASEIEAILLRARVALSQPAFIEQVIVPLMEALGYKWHEGSLRIMHEHLASAVVLTFMGNLPNGMDDATTAPKLIVTTPLGQLHEIGALIVASTAAADGWRMTYLGTNLLEEEIAAATQQQLAHAVALSLVYPADDPRLYQELTALRRYLGADVEVLVGGRGSIGYTDVLTAIGAVHFDDLAPFRAYLETIRTR